LLGRGGWCGRLRRLEVAAGRDRPGDGEGARDCDAAEKAAKAAGAGGILGGMHLRAPDM